MRFRLFVVALVSILILSLFRVHASASQDPALRYSGICELNGDYCEPNDGFAQACGPLVSGAIYDAYVWTAADYDYYYVDVGAGGIFEAILRFTPTNYDYYRLALYNQSTSVVASGTTISDGVLHLTASSLSPGRYYLLVQSGSGSSQSVPHELQVFVPLASTPTVTPTTTPTATQKPTATQTATPTPTATPTMTATATQTLTESPTSTASPTATQTHTPTSTRTLMPYQLYLPLVVRLFDPAATPSPTSTSTMTSTPTQTPTGMPTATSTFTQVPTPTETLTPMTTSTSTLTATTTQTPTETSTSMPSPTATETPTLMPTRTSTPVPPATPTGTNVHCRDYAGSIQICAWVSNGTPARYSNVTVYGRLLVAASPVSGAPMHTVWHYKTTTPTEDCTTGANGIGYCTRNIGGATAGYRVTVNVTITHMGSSYATSTSFTPR